MFSGRNTRLKYVNSIVIDVQQWQLNVAMMIDANAAVTLLEKTDLKKFSGYEQDFNLRPLRSWCDALPTELSKPHESGRVWVDPLCSVDIILSSSM